MDLYFEMYSGIAGDMTIGALLDLGASKGKLVDGIKSLGIGGYELVFERTSKNGIDAYNFDVLLESKGHHHHDHDHDCGCKGEGHHHHHDHECGCKGEGHHHHHDHECGCKGDDHHHHHDHECGCKGEGHHHHHDHEHECKGEGHHHHGDHTHRNLHDIEEIINASNLSDRVKKDSLGIFEQIALAEAKAHGIDKYDVHYHEVGAIDSIIDIVGVAILIEDLGVENIYFSDLYEGYGYQNCAHGPIPIPVPAVANILEGSNIKLNMIDEQSEHITPTGAAIVKYFYNDKKAQGFSIKKIGLGAGNKDFVKSTNILRIMEIDLDKKKA